MSKKKLTKHIWYGSETVTSEGKTQAAPPPIAVNDGSEGWHLSGLTRGELYLNDYAADPALFILASDNTIRRIGGEGNGSGGGSGNFSLVEGPGIKITSDTNKVYTISHGETSKQESVEKVDKKAVASVLVDDFGHVIGLDTCDILALEDLDLRYLRKDIDDKAAGNITFEQDIILSGEKSSIYSDRDADSFKHENGFRIFADGTAWVKDLKVKHDSMFAGSLSSPTFASGFPNGTGFMIAPYKVTNAAGVEETKYKLEIDSISVRNELKVYTFVVSQLLGENDNRIFAGMMEVDHYDPETGRIYLDTDGGRLYNPFREGDILMVQQFQGDPTLQNDYKMTKSYELKVVEVAVGDLSDGENRLDWLRFTNFVGNLSDIAKRDTLCRVDNPDNSTRSGIMKITTVDEFGTPYMDVIRGMKTDPENCVKVRVGNMNGLVTPYFGRLEGDGIYVENLYARGQFMLDTGENVKTKFEIVEGRLSSEMSSVRYELSEKDNCLTNASFSADTVAWVLGNDVSLFTVKERFMAVNDSFYAEKDKVTGIVEVSSRKALYIKNSGVKQLNSYLKNKPDGQLEMPDGTKVWPSYYVSFMYMVKTAGTLTSGFSGQGLYVSKPLAITDTFVQEEFSGKWNGTGDFILNYTGEIYIYNVQMSTHPVEDLRLEMSTLFLQTDEKIGMYAQKIDTLNGTVTNMGVELNNIDETLSLYVKKTDSINQTVTSLGIKLDGVDESLTLYAKKTDVSGLKTEMEAAIKVNADNINLKVSKDSIISSINQTAETIKINASRLNLNGFVTFSMFDLSTQNTIKNKVNSGDLGSMAWKDGVSSDDLSDALSKEIAGKINLATLNNSLTNYTQKGAITKEDLANALQAELTGKLSGSASNDAAGKLANIIVNGHTLIAGGYIQADLINADKVFANVASIAGFTIESNRLYNNSMSSGIELNNGRGTKFIYINSIGSSAALQVRNDYGTAVSIGSYDIGGTGLKVLGNTGATAIESYGPIALLTRDDEEIRMYRNDSNYLARLTFRGHLFSDYRTVINVGSLMDSIQIKTLIGRDPDGYQIRYDPYSGYIYVQV